MFTQFAMENLQVMGYRTGLRESEIPQVKQWLAEGKTVPEISTKLMVVESAIEGYSGAELTEVEKAAVAEAEAANSRPYYEPVVNLIVPEMSPGHVRDPATGIARREGPLPASEEAKLKARSKDNPAARAAPTVPGSSLFPPAQPDAKRK